MQNRFVLKVRKWAVSRVAEPFDVVVLDLVTGIMYHSGDTFPSAEEAQANLNVFTSFYDASNSLDVKQWTPDGTESDFNALPAL